MSTPLDHNPPGDDEPGDDDPGSDGDRIPFDDDDDDALLTSPVATSPPNHPSAPKSRNQTPSMAPTLTNSVPS
ncbi:hypothetical protein PAXRUDRAFT_22154 [Paxillus rubicundulus Ve08.2h10]|uniref:Uncharacterized protein n=1 Tax=Paxillus rubicundulus Ve08.2h10 TaxID=930991 RepID=A0A0D0C9I6_9AGAM|nr:hypothetical protein PAXRUDRAFT_22154 [Paxillus rubicundulus Ve08.2h10]